MSPGIESALLEIKESFVMALVAIRTNKLRSILTLLGIAVGVFSIIGVMTAMGVLVNSIQSGMSALGVNTFQIQKYSFFEGDPDDMPKYRNRKDITFEQGELVKDRAEFANLVGIFCAQYGKQVVSKLGLKTNPNVSLSGRTVEGLPPTVGRSAMEGYSPRMRLRMPATSLCWVRTSQTNYFRRSTRLIRMSGSTAMNSASSA